MDNHIFSVSVTDAKSITVRVAIRWQFVMEEFAQRNPVESATL